MADDKELEQGDEGLDESREQIQRDDREDEKPVEQETEAQEDDEQEEVAQPARESRFQQLSSAAREATERAAAAERRIQDLERRLEQTQPKPQEREPTAEEKSLWTPEEHMNYGLGKARKEFDQRLNQMQYQMADNTDRAGWEGYCNTDSRARAMAAEVEQRLQAARQNGVYLTRGQIYTYMVGEKALQRGSKATETQRQQGQRRIERQQVRGTSPKGDESRRGNAQLSEADQRNARLRERGFFDA